MMDFVVFGTEKRSGMILAIIFYVGVVLILSF